MTIALIASYCDKVLLFAVGVSYKCVSDSLFRWLHDRCVCHMYCSSWVSHSLPGTNQFIVKPSCGRSLYAEINSYVLFFYSNDLEHDSKQFHNDLSWCSGGFKDLIRFRCNEWCRNREKVLYDVTIPIENIMWNLTRDAFVWFICVV